MERLSAGRGASEPVLSCSLRFSSAALRLGFGPRFAGAFRLAMDALLISGCPRFSRACHFPHSQGGVNRMISWEETNLLERRGAFSPQREK
jgi:hypothetical protein